MAGILPVRRKTLSNQFLYLAYSYIEQMNISFILSVLLVRFIADNEIQLVLFMNKYYRLSSN